MRAAGHSRLAEGWVGDLADLLEERIGYRPPPHRMVREMAPFAMAEAEAAGLGDPRLLVASARAGRETAFWERLVDLATVGETYFFRHPEQIEAVATWARRRHLALGRPLRIWSAGCSTGDEAWSIAMRLDAADVPYRITASDVSASALARARAGGPYSDRSVGHLPAAYRARWFRERAQGGWWLREPPPAHVRFVAHNLVAETPLRSDLGPWDLVLCRNVAIYFRAALASRVVERLGRSLGDGASLWLAPCDLAAVGDPTLGWEREGPQRYLRRGGAKDRPVVPSESSAPPGAPPAERWRGELEACLARGLAGAGAEVLDRRLAEHPDTPAAWVARAALHVRGQEHAAALRALERAARLHPRPLALEHVRGLALLGAGRRDDALRAFLEAIRDDPDDWASGWHAADLYRRRGQSLLEEMMLRRTAELLRAPSPAPPAFGAAGAALDGIHREAPRVREWTLARLRDLARTGREATS